MLSSKKALNGGEATCFEVGRPSISYITRIQATRVTWNWGPTPASIITEASSQSESEDEKLLREVRIPKRYAAEVSRTSTRAKKRQEKVRVASSISGLR